jgi:hypothetical protein
MPGAGAAATIFPEAEGNPRKPSKDVGNAGRDQGCDLLLLGDQNATARLNPEAMD